MPGDDASVELTLERYETRGEDFEKDIETRWKVDAPGLDRPCAGETPEEALRVLAQMLGDDDGFGRSVDIEALIEAEPESDEWGES